MTALMVAAEGRHVETVVALIIYGASVNLKDSVSCWRSVCIGIHGL